MPSSSALVSFDAPGPSPTTTAVVFFDTLPGALPPRDLMASSVSLAVVVLERAGDHDRQAVEGLGHLGRCRALEVHAGRPQPVEHGAVGVLAEPRVTAGR